jgi:hypothetical protein
VDGVHRDDARSNKAPEHMAGVREEPASLAQRMSRKRLGLATVSEEHIAAWRNHLLAGRSDRTKRRYARSTVSSYIRTVCDFYEWAHKRGHVAQNPVRLIPKAFSRADGLLAHLGPNPDHLTKKVLVRKPLLSGCRTSSRSSSVSVF